MLYLTCTMISSVGFAHYGVSRAKDWVSVDCGTRLISFHVCLFRFALALITGNPLGKAISKQTIKLLL